MQLVEQRPWDFIEIPSVKTTNGTFFPVVYGAYGAETSTVASKQFCESATVFPSPVWKIVNDNIYCLLHKAVTDGRLHNWNDNAINPNGGYTIYVPYDEANDTSAALGSGNAITTKTDLNYGAKIRASEVLSTGGGGYMTDRGNVLDASGATFGYWDWTAIEEQSSDGNNCTFTLSVEQPSLDYELQALLTGFTYEIDVTADTGLGGTRTMDIDIYSDSYAGGGNSIASITHNLVDGGVDTPYDGALTTGTVNDFW